MAALGVRLVARQSQQLKEVLEMSIAVQQTAAEDARQFNHFSIHNAVQAQLACPEGTCEAYKDIFTFRRWKQQGFFVHKGEKGTRITTWIPKTITEEDGTKKIVGKRPKVAIVFCRHQVERKAVARG